MKCFYKIFISAFLAFLIAFQGGAFAHACQCMGMTVKKHHCCPEMQQEQQKPPCPHHQGSQKQDKAVTKLSVNQACHCEMGSQSQQALKPTESVPFEEQLVLVGVIATDPVQDLYRTFVQKPTWLRRIYYPDKSALYLETSRLLI